MNMCKLLLLIIKTVIFDEKRLHSVATGHAKAESDHVISLGQGESLYIEGRLAKRRTDKALVDNLGD